MDLKGCKVFWMESDGVPPRVTIIDADKSLIQIDAQNASPGIYEMMLESQNPYRATFFELKVK